MRKYYKFQFFFVKTKASKTSERNLANNEFGVFVLVLDGGLQKKNQNLNKEINQKNYNRETECEYWIRVVEKSWYESTIYRASDEKQGKERKKIDYESYPLF